MTVVVAESMGVVLLDLRETLLDLGIGHVLGASSAGHALKLIAAAPIDFAIVDAELDEAGNRSIAVRLEQLRVPYVLMSARWTAADWHASSNHADFLAKPFSTAELDAAIRRLTGA